MNTAGGVCLSVLSSFLAVAGALAAASALAPVSLSAPASAADSGAEGSLSSSSAASSSSLCSSLVAGVLYGSFSLRELFPSRLPGCSWSLENPDPTKYSLYLRFTRHPSVCRTHSPVLLSLDHHLANQSCPLRPHADPVSDREAVDLCWDGGGGGGREATSAFLKLDKNFVQLCLSRHPAPDQPPLAKETLELRLVEVLLINKENSSQFTCSVLCRWLEECLRGGHHSGESHEDHGDDGCGVTQTGCVCPNPNMAAVPPAVPWLPATPHAAATAGDGSPGPDACCVTEQNSNVAIAIVPRDVRQAGDPAAEEWSQWSVCSLTCSQGWQVRTRSCVSSPYGTLCSGALRETRMCNNTAACPGADPGILSSVDGQWLEWSPWSQCSVTCGAGSEQRQRRCSSAAHSWAECQGEHQERRGCSKPSCSGGVNWGSWNHWSLCSKSCDSGWQQRFRMCDGPGLQGSSCQGSREEDRTCNHKNHCGGKRTLAGEGMSQIVRSLLELLQRRSFHSGDLLFSTHILRNVTDTFKRATYIPAPDDRFFQVVSFLLDMENMEQWEDVHQVSPGAALLMRILEDFIHLIGEAQKPFQSVLVVTNNLMITIQREPGSAVSSDINFPMKGRRGMKDWARTTEDKLYIPKEVFTAPAEEAETETEALMYYVIGAILYRTLGSILPAPKPPGLINSKILAVTVRPEPQHREPMVVVELSPLLNGTSDPQCVVWDYGNPSPH
ncbi:hypothetical protein NHX12_023395, partial [Muraenolepis orangiensis]